MARSVGHETGDDSARVRPYDDVDITDRTLIANVVGPVKDAVLDLEMVEGVEEADGEPGIRGSHP